MTDQVSELQGVKVYTPVRVFGLIFGLLLFAMPHFVAPPEGLSPEGWKVVGVALLMATWWVTGPVHVSVTALLPLVALPLMGVMNLKAVTAGFSHPLVFLFLAGFLIARALQRWNLHKRIALTIASSVGTRPDMLILGFMVAVAFLSMWVSNTATTIMMLPVAVSVISYIGFGDKVSKEMNGIGTAMMLGIAYAASIGGIGTLVGTPPNAFLAAFLSKEHGVDISFSNWMMFAMPLVVVLLPLVWFILTRFLYPECCAIEHKEGAKNGRDVVVKELQSLGPMQVAEKRVGLVFLLVAALWIFRPLLKEHVSFLSSVNDTSIGIFCGLLLFLLPSGNPGAEKDQRLLSWREAEKLPWGVLILFGGGLSLAAAIGSTGVSGWIGTNLEMFKDVPLIVLILIVAGTILLLTELTSNTATTAAFLPIVAALAVTSGLAPTALAIPAALAASCAFMLPVATPPNAAVFASGYITVQQMVRAGVVANVLALLLIVLASRYLLPLIF